MNERDNTLKAFSRLLDIMDELREKCPWDREQTMDSLRPLTIEETFELSDAILNGEDGNRYQNITKELGDILLHIIFYAKIGSELNAFSMEDVIQRLSEKLVYRHPHVFGSITVEGSNEVVENWEKLKMTEKGGNRGVLGGVPSTLPALIKAYRIQDKVRAAGFDWDEREQVWEKVEEEIVEFKEECQKRQTQEMEEEFGDVLFSLVNAARLYGINPETALERTNRKFIKRFNYLEQEAKRMGKTLQQMTLQEMDVIWEKGKEAEGGRQKAEGD